MRGDPWLARTWLNGKSAPRGIDISGTVHRCTACQSGLIQ